MRCSEGEWLSTGDSTRTTVMLLDTFAKPLNCTASAVSARLCASLSRALTPSDQNGRGSRELVLGADGAPNHSRIWQGIALLQWLDHNDKPGVDRCRAQWRLVACNPGHKNKIITIGRLVRW